jgi:hypothetical protein
VEIIRQPTASDLARFARDATETKALYGLPNNVRFCCHCVISNQRPNSAVEYKHTRDTKKETINFDENRLCDVCSFTITQRALNLVLVVLVMMLLRKFDRVTLLEMKALPW